MARGHAIVARANVADAHACLSKTAACMKVAVSAQMLATWARSYHDMFSLKRASLLAHVVLDFSHPWHAYPAAMAATLISVSLGLVTLPLSLIECMVRGRSPFRKTRPGMFLSAAGYVGMAVGFAIGLPFFVVGLPLERLSTRGRHSGGDTSEDNRTTDGAGPS